MGTTTTFPSVRNLFVCTLAERPVATAVVKYVDRFLITDVGIGGSEWFSDGVRWRAVGGSVVLKNDITGAVTVTTGTLTKMLSYNSVVHKAGDIFEICASITKNTVTGATSTIRVALGATDTNTLTPNLIEASTATNNVHTIRLQYKVVDATTLLLPTPYSATGTASTGVGSAGTIGTVGTVAGGDLTSSVWFGIYGLLGGTITTDVLTLRDFTVTLKTCG